MAEPITKMKRKWVEIVAPKVLNNQVLGESFVTGPEALVGRAITVNLSDFTGDPRQQSASIMFRITGVDNGMAMTNIERFITSPALIKRLVRRQTTRIDDIVVCSTADQQAVVIKFFIVTKAVARSSAIKALRVALKEESAKILKASSVDDVIKSLSTNKFQTQIKNSLKKIYPLKTCEVKMMSITSKDLPKDLKEQKPKAKDPAEEKTQEKPAKKAQEAKPLKDVKKDSAKK